ncbi:hypothetical protein C0992_006579 [Termitomyces sp. T32_za158]|nr:hypothetical protein C0992_006579 [Termitomyces sp. T32_za158]
MVDYQQFAAAPYLGHEAPLPYETPLHARMEVDQEEEHHECQFQEVRHKRYYQPGPSRRQAPAQTYARAVAPAVKREVAPQAQSEMGTEVLLQQLEAAGQPVPPMASFLQDNLAIMVMEGLLDQIELIRRQCVSALEQIDRAAKRKLSSLEGVSGEIKRAQPQPARPVESARPLRTASSWSIPAMALAPLSLPAWPTAVSTVQLAVVATVAHEPKVPDAPVEERLLDQRDEEMGEVPLTREDHEFMDHFKSMASSAGQKLQSEEEEEAKEGELAAQRFQHVQRNKKLAKKKANRAKAAAALAHRAQNDFSGRIPDGLGVKVWGPLDVERLNSCFRGALGPCCYYLSLTNTVFVGADANRAVAFEFSSGQLAKVPGMKVYQFARRGFPGTPYKLERLYKYYANPHVPWRDRIVAYMLWSKLKDFTQRCNVALHDHTMTLLCSNPTYRDLINPMQGPEDLSYAEKCHIPSRFLRIKDDGMIVLCVTRTPDPNVPFNLDQIA